ncbi:MAG TPA: hypothetical protein VIV40_37845 [Kofleriaceae bacterium]
MIVFRAFLGAQFAGEQAAVHLAAEDSKIWLLVSREDSTGRDADVGAVLIEPNAALEHRDVLLTQASITARRTSLRAVEAGVDAIAQLLACEYGVGRVGLDHLRRVHVSSSRSLARGMARPTAARGAELCPPSALV